MGRHDLPSGFSDDQLRAFMKAILADVHALERMLDEDRFETGVRRIGAEQEMFLVDRSGRAWNGVEQMMRALSHPQFTYELAQFNLECNLLLPQVFGGDCLSKMEAELVELLRLARRTAADQGGGIVLCGILPTLRRSDLTLESMVQNPRYLALNNAIATLRGGEFQFRIKGVDEFDMTHDNVMLESCNTSFQVHFQAGPKEFAKLYNVAQAITAPVLAASTNSPLLLGRRLWRETRVALFQQSVDARSAAHQLRGRRPRVDFGDHWLRDSVLEIFREDIARFRVVLASNIDEDPEAVLDRGVPAMTALRLHNGTVYRWNRACYGISNGKPHLRIEARAFPSGPTPADEMATAAFFFGLMAAVSNEFEDVSKAMSFDDAKGNFVAAARLGMQANLTWFHGREFSAQELIGEVLLPMARQGLESAKLDSGDIDRYLGILEERCKRGRTGARWVLDLLSAMGDKGTKDQRMAALVRAMQLRQEAGQPVHTWDLADTGEFEGWKESYVQVGQFVTTDLFTVHPEDVVDLAASLMDWRHIRHVPVEDNDGNLVGLVSHRTLLRLVGQGMRGAERTPVAVKDIMIQQPISVRASTPTLEAIELMRKHRIGCLPVIEEGNRLVGIITERDLIRVAAMLFEKHLRESDGQ